MKILFFGDLVGDPGRSVFARHHDTLRKQYGIDITIVNGENSAQDGRGITPTIAQWFFDNNVALITTGNHIWAKREIIDYIKTSKLLLRPANFPTGCPGTGVAIVYLPNGLKVGVINVLGRVFMRDAVDCPFRTLQSAVQYISAYTPLILVDVHAETTAEKAAIANHFDGKVSVIVGTHTHVQTADERILPLGTGFITDVGMGGAVDSMIGMKKEPIIQQFLTQMPVKFSVATEGPLQLCAVVVTLDETTGHCISIERLRIVS